MIFRIEANKNYKKWSTGNTEGNRLTLQHGEFVYVYTNIVIRDKLIEGSASCHVIA